MNMGTPEESRRKVEIDPLTKKMVMREIPGTKQHKTEKEGNPGQQLQQQTSADTQGGPQMQMGDDQNKGKENDRESIRRTGSSEQMGGTSIKGGTRSVLDKRRRKDSADEAVFGEDLP